jgi:uncharacterized NAD(P)/FAD-binding protein YdhS
MAVTVQSEAPKGRLHIHTNPVTALKPKKSGYFVPGEEGDIAVDAVVLALGNVPPAHPHLEEMGFISDPRYLCNPWQRAEAIRRIDSKSDVLILGSGLTAMDALLQLRQQGHGGRIHLISRHGRWSKVHQEIRILAPYVSPKLTGCRPSQAMKLLREKVREVELEGGDWRQVVHGIRDETNAIWEAWTLNQRRSFLTHARPYWDIHRHRMAAEVWQAIEQEIEKARIKLSAGRIQAISPGKKGLTIHYRGRYQQEIQKLKTDFVINCTGPEALRRQHCQPLVRSLLDQNLAAPDPLHLGLATAPDGALLNADGHPVPGLFAMGPVRRGSLWETTAVPEIRVQAANLAEQITRYFAKDRSR